MKTTIVLMLSLFLVVSLNAGSKSAGKAELQFEKMKSLVGTWKGKDDEGKEVGVSYKLVSNGTSLMETLDMPDHTDAMVTMYHLDGSKLMMTHYCSMGNQPRMRADAKSKEDNAITFAFVDATNMASKKDSHMSKLVVTFTDNDHISHQWSMSANGEVAHTSKFDFERVK